MSYANSLLADGEHITYRTKQHWLAPLAEARTGVLLVVAALVLLAVGVFVVHVGDDMVGTAWKAIEFILFIVGLAWLVMVYLGWSAEDYVVTDRRVLKIEGIVNKHAADSSLDKINDALVEQHLLGRILGYGDLQILTAAEESVDTYTMLNHVLTFKRAMLNAKHEVDIGYRQAPAPPLRAGAAAGAGAAPMAPVAAGGAPVANGAGPAARASVPEQNSHRMTPDEVTQTLARLADLRDRGAITPEEYEGKKRELLDRI